MKELEEAMDKLRHKVAVKERKIRSLQMLEDIAYWQMMQHYQKIVDEIERHKLVKAGFEPK